MGTAKKQIYNSSARKLMMEGIDEVADVVGSTLGAKGRNVILSDESGIPSVVNDGFKIIKDMGFKNKVKDSAAQLIKGAAIHTNITAGDGTTGATVLSRAIVKEGWKEVEEGANPVLLRKEIEAAMKDILKSLKDSAKDVTTQEEKAQVASVSAQDEEVGGQIGEMMEDIGVGGGVTFQGSTEKGVVIERDDGMRLEGQPMQGVFDDKEGWKTELNGARVLVLKDSPEDHEFEKKWLPLLKHFISPGEQGGHPSVNVPVFLIVAEKLSRRLIMTMARNTEHIKWVWFRPTTANKNMSEIYKDLSSITGGKVVDEEAGFHLNTFSIEDMGKVDVASMSRHGLVITVGEERMKSEDYLARVSVVECQIENAEDLIEKEQIKERYANLTGGVATIKIGSPTGGETTELNLRVEDAVNATRSAMEEGVVPGGGVALLNASKVLKGSTAGERVLKTACLATVTQILHNAGYEDDKIEKTIKELEKVDGIGVNVLTDEMVNMVEAGIIDPHKVIRCALENAVSVSALLITSEFLVTDADDDIDVVRNFFTAK